MSITSHAMSARRLPKRSENTLSKRREELRQEVGHDKITHEQATRAVRAKMSWREWFIEDYARYWYVIGAIALDVFVGFGLAQAYHVEDAAGMIGIVSILIVLLVGEYLLFTRLWPEAGFLEDDD